MPKVTRQVPEHKSQSAESTEGGYSQRFSELNAQMTSLEKRVDSFERDKIAVISTMGIFIAAFALISGEFGLLKSFSAENDLAGFIALSLIFGSFILGFFLLLEIYSHSWLGRDDKKMNTREWVLAGILLTFFVTGVFINFTRNAPIVIQIGSSYYQQEGGSNGPAE